MPALALGQTWLPTSAWPHAGAQAMASYTTRLGVLEGLKVLWSLGGGFGVGVGVGCVDVKLGVLMVLDLAVWGLRGRRHLGPNA